MVIAMKKCINRGLLLGLLVCMGGTVSAQKKEISQAKINVKKGVDLAKTEENMSRLLQIADNRQNKKIWLLKFEAIKKQYEQGNEKLYLNQKYDTALLYNAVKRMFQTGVAFDSVEMQPNAKGKVKIEYRNEHAAYLHNLRPNLYYGGLYFLTKHKNEDAFSFFDTYIRSVEEPLFATYHYDKTDKRLLDAAFWTVLAGHRMKNFEATMKYVHLAKKDTARLLPVLRFVAEAYQEKNDTTHYLAALEEGFEHYPTSQYFFPLLFEYHARNGNWQRALDFCNDALKNDTASTLYRVAKSTALLNMGQYDECIVLCDSVLAKAPGQPDALLNAGLAYYNKGVEIDKNYKTQWKQRRKISDCYKQAVGYLEPYREKAPEKKEKWGLPLYTIYLNLNMGKEFDEIDKLLNSRGNTTK